MQNVAISDAFELGVGLVYKLDRKGVFLLILAASSPDSENLARKDISNKNTHCANAPCPMHAPISMFGHVGRGSLNFCERCISIAC